MYNKKIDNASLIFIPCRGFLLFHRCSLLERLRKWHRVDSDIDININVKNNLTKSNNMKSYAIFCKLCTGVFLNDTADDYFINPTWTFRKTQIFRQSNWFIGPNWRKFGLMKNQGRHYFDRKGRIFIFQLIRHLLKYKHPFLHSHEIKLVFRIDYLIAT